MPELATEPMRGPASGVRRLDRVGMVVSTLCAIHCFALPFVLGALPFVGIGFVADSWFERGMVGLAALIGIASLVRGHEVHHRHTAWCLFVPGVALVALGLLFLQCTCFASARPLYGYNVEEGRMVVIRWVPTPPQFPWRAVVMAAGGLSIAAAHFVNARLCRSCHRCEDHRHAA